MWKRWIAAAACGLLLAACAGKRPVLYPNAQLQRAGADAAQRDVDECLRQARESGVDEERGREVAGSTAGGAAVGGAAGAAGGAVLGNIGRGAAAGAAGGAAGGLVHGLFRSSEPDPVLKKWVERCLRDKGYDPIGWK